MVDDILAPLQVRLHVFRRFRQRHQRVALAACIRLVVGPRVDLGRDVLPILLLRAVGGRRNGQRDVREHGEGGDGFCGADGYAVGAQAGDRSRRQEILGPGPGGEDDVGCGERGRLGGGGVDVGDRFDGGVGRGGGVVDGGDGRAGEDPGALFGGERGHGRGEVVGVHLRRRGRVAHFAVVECAVGGDPVEVGGDAGGAETAEGLGGALLEGDGLAVFGAVGGGFGVVGVKRAAFGAELPAVYAPVAPSVGAVVLSGQLGVQAVTQGDDVAGVGCVASVLSIGGS